MTESTHLDRIFEFRQRLKAVRRELDSLGDDMNEYSIHTLKHVSDPDLDLTAALCVLSIGQGATLGAFHTVENAEEFLAGAIRMLRKHYEKEEETK